MCLKLDTGASLCVVLDHEVFDAVRVAEDIALCLLRGFYMFISLSLKKAYTKSVHQHYHNVFLPHLIYYPFYFLL